MSYQMLLHLLITIFIHELGHLVIAKLLNETIEEFSIGIGPLIMCKTYKGTKYSLRMLPVGGYCLRKNIDYKNKYTPIRELLLSLGGILFNFIFIILLIAYVITTLNINDTIASLLAINITVIIFNIIPFPGLDGWSILISIISIITRKDIKRTRLNTILLVIGNILLIFYIIINLIRYLTEYNIQ